MGNHDLLLKSLSKGRGSSEGHRGNPYQDARGHFDTPPGAPAHKNHPPTHQHLTPEYAQRVGRTDEAKPHEAWHEGHKKPPQKGKNPYPHKGTHGRTEHLHDEWKASDKEGRKPKDKDEGGSPPKAQVPPPQAPPQVPPPQAPPQVPQMAAPAYPMGPPPGVPMQVPPPQVPQVPAPQAPQVPPPQAQPQPGFRGFFNRLLGR